MCTAVVKKEESYLGLSQPGRLGRRPPLEKEQVMKTNFGKWRHACLFAGFLGVGVAPLVQADDLTRLVAPIGSNPGGQSYGRWAVEWWQWALGVPAAANPVVDTTGAYCAQRQVDKVWFLAGSFGPGSVQRKCEVPAGKSLFFPLINISYGAFLNDLPDTRTDQYIRAAGSCTEPAQISVSINGTKVGNPTQYFTGRSGSPSPFFNVQLPPGNLFGLDEAVANELVLSPSAEQGYYLFVNPLPPGKHQIKWIASGCTPGNSQDITYHLTVVGKGGKDD